jgi:hypothetical protein
VSRPGRVILMLIGLSGAILGDTAPALAQSNLDAGKSPAQIFADTCNGCHRSAREIRPAGPGFLRQHYTTGAREAAAMAAYLAAIGSDPRAVQQRRPPAMGAGRGPAAETGNRPGEAAAHPGDPAKPAAAPAAASAASKVRRPSDSMDASTGSAPAGQPETAAASAVTQGPADAFEE